VVSTPGAWGLSGGEWTEQVEQLFDDLGRGTPDDMPVVVKKEALDQAAGMVAIFLARRVVLSEPGEWDLDNRRGLTVVEDEGIGIRQGSDKRAHEVITARRKEIVELAKHLHMGWL